MKSAPYFQTLASILFVGSFLASECAARLLDAHPTSVLAWELNLGAFRAFEHARTQLGAAHILFSPASLPTASMLLFGVIAAHAFRCRFAIALLANLSFLGALALCYAVLGAMSGRASAFTVAAFARDAQLPLVACLVMTSFIGFAASHWSFLRVIASAMEASSAASERSGRHPTRLRLRENTERSFPFSRSRAARAPRPDLAARPSAQAEYC